MTDRDAIASPAEPDPASAVRIAHRQRFLPAWRDPVVLILFVAGIFDGLSGNPIHSVLLFCVGIALATQKIDAIRPQGNGPVVETVREHRLPLLAAVVYAVAVGSFARYSWPATVAVLLLGLAAIVLAWRATPQEGAIPRPSSFGLGVWAGLVTALGLFELANLLLQPSFTTDSYAHPTLSVLTDPALASHPGRSIGLFVWLASGWFLVGR